MRWSMTLACPAVAAGEELSLGPDAQGRSVRVSIRLQEAFLEVTAEVRCPKVPAAPAYPEWYNRRHLVLFVNPGHDHATRWMYAVDDAGEIHHTSVWAMVGEEPSDELESPLAPGPAATGQYENTPEGFRATLRLPAKDIWPEQAVVAGVAVKVGFHEECIPPALCWPEEARSNCPFDFGDLYRREPSLRVEKVDVPSPSWGPGTVKLFARGRDNAPDAGEVRVSTLLPGEAPTAQPPVAWRGAGDSVRVDLPLVWPHRGKWVSDIRSTARVALRVEDSKGECLWHAEYPVGFDAGIIVRERFGCRDGQSATPRPSQNDPDFVEHFRRYILDRLPDYQPATTRGGAPSDYCLRDPAGQADLNLLDADWPDQVASMLAGRFGRWDDAICAASMWVYHPAVTRHSSSWNKVSGRATIRTIPRLGGCFCGDTARLTALLVEKVGEALGVSLRGLSMGLRGHLVTLVETPGGRVVLDGMIGLWFHALDNARLATLEEMRTDRAVVDRMWFAPRAHGHEFYFGIDDQMIRSPEPGTLIWPEGAE